MEETTRITVTSRKLSWRSGSAILHPDDAAKPKHGGVLEVIVDGLDEHLFYRYRRATQEDVDRADEGLLRLKEEIVERGRWRDWEERWIQTTSLPFPPVWTHNTKAE